ncbi:MAG: hypothetical protein ACJ764_13585 [Solirubrobacteraceae bacterium]
MSMLGARRTWSMLLAPGFMVLALAGCGSGGGGQTAGSGGPTSFNPRHIPKSAPIASTAYYNTLVKAFSASGAMTSSQATFAAHCIQNGLVAAGFKTQGQSEGANAPKALAIAGKCVQQARGH